MTQGKQGNDFFQLELSNPGYSFVTGRANLNPGIDVGQRFEFKVVKLIPVAESTSPLAYDAAKILLRLKSMTFMRSCGRAKALFTRKLISDHTPFLVTSQRQKLMGWNILCQMQFNRRWEFFNNGFGCHAETTSEYKNRLSHISERIHDEMKTEKSAIVCLQETPETVELRQHFVNDLMLKTRLTGFEIQYFNNDKEEYYLITLYDKSLYMLHDELTQRMQAVTLTEGFQGRILPLVFRHKHTQETLLA